MAQGKEEEWERRALELIGRRWKEIVFLVWLGLSAWFIWQKWGQIRWFGLGDTDDNMRIMQVRAWLHGQGWYDLRNYRMNPPIGAIATAHRSAPGPPRNGRSPRMSPAIGRSTRRDQWMLAPNGGFSR